MSVNWIVNGSSSEPRMIFGVSATRNTVVIAHTTGSRERFAIKSITSIHFEARSGDDSSVRASSAGSWTCCSRA
jgi:hypothetical protein